MVAVAACAGGAPSVAQAPAQPAPAALPAPAAPAADPEAARALPGQTMPAPVAPAQPAVRAPGEPKYGGIAKFAMRRDGIRGFDRMQTGTYYDIHMPGSGLWGNGNLVRMCRDNIYAACPALAESWETNDDFTQWTFKIREDVLWHDGTPFTVDDAKFWLDMNLGTAEAGGNKRPPSVYKSQFGDVVNTEILDGNRVRITLGDAIPFYPNYFNRPENAVAHPKRLTEPRIAAGEVKVTPVELNFIGTGPFKIEEYEKGIAVRIRRFDGYWEKDAAGQQLPYLDGVDYAIITDPSAMDAAFLVGRLDGGALGSGHSLSLDRKGAYDRRLGDEVYYTNPAGTCKGPTFNTLKDGPLKDVRVRQAINLWYDRVSSVSALVGGLGGVCAMFQPDNPYTTPDFIQWPGWNPATRAADKAEAKRLLAEAGYAVGAKVNAICYTSRSYMADCEFTQDQLRSLGIEMEIVPADSARWSAERYSLDYDISPRGGFGFVPIPEMAERAMGAYSKFFTATGKHEDPKVAQLFQSIKSAVDFTERVRLWRELERYYVAEQVYTLTAYYNESVVPYRSYLKGIINSPEVPTTTIDPAIIWLDE